MTTQKTNDAIDAPDSRDYNFETYMNDFAEGDKLVARPYSEIILRDQKTKPYCTRYWLTHVVNGENINEYNSMWLKYKQENPDVYWDRWNKIKNIQEAMKDFRKFGLIELSFKINKTKWVDSIIEQVRKAFWLWMFIYTWSSNWDWWKFKANNYTYVKRKDWKFVWHARCIVDDIPEKKLLKCLNSRWDDRWDKWYFYLPYEYVLDIYNMYPILDKDESSLVNLIKAKELSKQIISISQNLYSLADEETKRFFEKIQLGSFLKNKYWV